jgi:tripartite ATP-independent transporter DctM subunit
MFSVSPEISAILIVLSVLILLASGFPVAFSLLSITIIGYLFLVGPQALYTISPIFFKTLTTDIFVAVPMFIFMAAVFEASGIGDRMYDAMYKWMAGVRGGLAMGTVLLCTIIAAIAGLVGTAEVTMGLLAYPGMRKRGYDKKLSIGCILAGGSLGPLIPPSVPMILVSSLSSVSSGKLFITGVFPGLICSFLFCLYIGIRSFLNKSLAPTMLSTERPNWREKFASLRYLIAPIFLVILVLGGIYSGAFTPSEAGGIGAAGAVVCSFIMRTFNRKTLWRAISTAFRINAMVMWLALAGSAFSSLAGSTGVNVFVGELISSMPLGSTGILILMLLITLVMGCFIDTVAIIMINLPIMMPVATMINVDPLFFAFLFTMCLIIGMITPPFGYALFYFKGLGFEEVKMEDIYRSVLPYVTLTIIVLILCFIFPSIPLWLPGKMIR